MPDYEKLLNAIDAAEETSYGSDTDSELSKERALAIDYYLGKNIEAAPEGRSQVVDRSVYETVQWIQPSLCRIFANGDDVVELPPLGPDDEEAAKQEAAYLNYIILQKNNWFEIFNTASKDAMLTKAGYLCVNREKRTQIELEKYERQTAEAVAIIMQDKPEVVSIEEYPDEEAQPQIDPMTGQPLPPAMLYDLEIRRTKEDTVYTIEVLPPENCKISKRCKTVQLTDCPYFEYFDYCTISELREMGLDVKDDIEGDEEDDTEEDSARDLYGEEIADDSNPVDPAQRRVKTRWIWIKYDYDEDGKSELQYVIRVGQEVLHREEITRIPVAVICPDPLPHRHVGLSVADTVMDIQQTKTAILRQGLDNLYLSNNPRQFADPSLVNLDDMLVSRPGGIVRTRNGAIFGQHFGAYPIPFVFPQAMEGMEYMDQIRENRTGTNRYFTGIDQNAMNKTATGIQQLSTMAAQRVEQIARTYSPGLEALFSILHEMVLKGGHRSDVVKLRGKWVEVNPATWRKRMDFRISVGYAAGNKDAMVSRLMLIAQLQEKAAMGGAPIVQPQNLYETAIEITKASDFAAPERFWTDPANAPPPQPPQPDPTVVAVEQLKAQNEQTIKSAEIQSSERETAAKLEMEKYKVDKDAEVTLTVEQMKAQHAAEVEQIRARNSADIENVKASNQIGIEQIKGQQAQTLERAKSQTSIRLAKAKGVEVQPEADDEVTKAEADEIKQAVQHLAQVVNSALTARRSIRRGKDGRAEGVDILGEDGSVLHSQSIVRGPDGRVLGAQ
jgi:hypothetical protein